MADFQAAQAKPAVVPADLDLIELRIIISRPDPAGPVVIQGPVSARLITAEKSEHSRPEVQFDDLPAAWKNADITTWNSRWNAIKAKLIPQ